ncbi:ATP-binding cassette domain-containing protein [Spirochaeta isovalerica]|uniref:ABC-type lipoprotein export system ATPase subunit n=1 Tax=Spirochaeta isovalerica TaxID=150 RepID=A0A841RGG0_9SPIO|nr:ATP-binding cassette domain-containing protein [Spirochaeta isovalerica]MBB6482100.1 ABC-type lipoprotein export system ATPase subunit [Spirochaeta isovalerica]
MSLSVKESTLGEILNKYPFAAAYLEQQNLKVEGRENMSLNEYLSSLSEDEIEERALDRTALIEGLESYIAQMLAFLGEEEQKVSSLSILSGADKSGEPEGFDDFTIRTGEIIAIVGPTGSGKSRLLGDIEWVAQRDTPTNRQILINGKVPDSKWRFSTSDKLVAQLSQNMNFVMDLTVEEFLHLHAESRMVENRDEVVRKIISCANDLAGEKFELTTPITSLSGGQSRALMISDTAILSRSPIILIDEIENAGIDRKKALSFLLSQEKIVLMATHDPMLALLGDKRIVIKNGGIHKIIETSSEERAMLEEIEKVDRKVQNLRASLRRGEILTRESF